MLGLAPGRSLFVGRIKRGRNLRKYALAIASSVVFVVDGDLAIHGGAPFGWNAQYAAQRFLGIHANATAQLMLVALAIAIVWAVMRLEGERRIPLYICAAGAVLAGSVLARLVIRPIRSVTMWKEPLVYAWMATILAVLLAVVALAVATSRHLRAKRS